MNLLDELAPVRSANQLGGNMFAVSPFDAHPVRYACAGVAALSIGLANFGLVLASPAGASARAMDKHQSHKSNSGCASFKPGKNGVVRDFCNGKAVVKVVVGTSTTTIKGGTCASSGGYFTVNAGVVVDPTFKGSKPNYFGLDAPPHTTTFSNAVLAYAVNGTGDYATKNSGTVASNHKSGTFSGTDLSGHAVSGSFTC
jgi:hypothetical protein